MGTSKNLGKVLDSSENLEKVLGPSEILEKTLGPNVNLDYIENLGRPLVSVSTWVYLMTQLEPRQNLRPQ